MSDIITPFITTLQNKTFDDSVFNPWRDVDKDNDVGAKAPAIRRRHLRHYLQARVGKAKYAFIGEALGYQGGHFSGLAMTSERILLGHLKDKGIFPEHVLTDLTPQRTSKPAIKSAGFTEPTGTIVWSTLLQNGLQPTEFVLWNTFAWHPYDPAKGPLSNRRPKTSELIAGEEALRLFLGLFPNLFVFATGRVATDYLQKLQVECYPVRHPAQGGATKFREQVKKRLDF